MGPQNKHVYLRDFSYVWIKHQKKTVLSAFAVHRSDFLKYGLRHRLLKSLPLCSNLFIFVSFILPTLCCILKFGKSSARITKKYSFNLSAYIVTFSFSFCFLFESITYYIRAEVSPIVPQNIISPTHKRTEGRAPVWGSEFTSKRRRTTGGIQQKPL